MWHRIALLVYILTSDAVLANDPPQVIHAPGTRVAEGRYISPNQDFSIGIPTSPVSRFVFIREMTHTTLNSPTSILDVKFLLDDGSIISIVSRREESPVSSDPRELLDRVMHHNLTNTSRSHIIEIRDSRERLGSSAVTSFNPAVYIQRTVLNERHGNLNFPYGESHYRGDALNSLGIHRYLVINKQLIEFMIVAPAGEGESQADAKMRLEASISEFISSFAAE